jgi:hypothetical protein
MGHLVWAPKQRKMRTSTFCYWYFNIARENSHCEWENKEGVSWIRVFPRLNVQRVSKQPTRCNQTWLHNPSTWVNLLMSELGNDVFRSPGTWGWYNVISCCLTTKGPHKPHCQPGFYKIYIQNDYQSYLAGQIHHDVISFQLLKSH